MAVARARPPLGARSAVGGARVQPRHAAARPQPRRRRAVAVRADASVSLHFFTSFVCFYTAWTWVGLRRARIQVRHGRLRMAAHWKKWGCPSVLRDAGFQ